MTVDYRRARHRAPDNVHTSAIAQLEWPQAYLSWPEFDADSVEYSVYSPDPRVTEHDVRTAIGPQADDLLRDLDFDVDELIRLINAETTIMPVIPDYVPDEFTQDRTGPRHARVLDEPDYELAVATQTWKQRFLKGTIAALLISLTGGGASALAMNKSVTVTVDGVEQSVNTFGSTVGDVLESADIKVGAHDALSPSPHATVGDGGAITLERGRELDLIVDGKQRQSWVRATSVQEALGQLGMTKLLSNGAWISAPRNAAVPLDGMTLQVKTLKGITLFDGGDKSRQVTTHAVTVEEFLQDQNLELGKQDEVTRGLQRALLDGSEIHIIRTGESVVNVKEPISAPVKEIEDNTLDAGTEKVVKQGRAGQKMVTYRVTTRNNEMVKRQALSTKVLKKPEARVIRIGTKQPLLSDEAVWDRLAFCESSGNWAISTGNGYYGGLQFDKQTWDAYGGNQYAVYPHEASREQQIITATKLRDARGDYSAWPACRAKLGLP